MQDDVTGTCICLGRDGLGCGVVVQHNRLLSTTLTPGDDNSFELYSPQNQFSVQPTRNSHFKRMNETFEKNLSRYGREDTITSDAYKDDQRKQVYSLLDHVQMYSSLSLEEVNKVKLLFHEFRTKMYRIHKLETALCCLIYIVFNY